MRFGVVMRGPPPLEACLQPEPDDELLIAHLVGVYRRVDAVRQDLRERGLAGEEHGLAELLLDGAGHLDAIVRAIVVGVVGGLVGGVAPQPIAASRLEVPMVTEPQLEPELELGVIVRSVDHDAELVPAFGRGAAGPERPFELDALGDPPTEGSLHAVDDPVAMAEGIAGVAHAELVPEVAPDPQDRKSVV